MSGSPQIVLALIGGLLFRKFAVKINFYRRADRTLPDDP